jgi:hypothetical protein
VVDAAGDEGGDLVRTAIALLVLVGVARADNVGEARRHFDDGTKFYDIGDFAHAAEEYKQAYLATPRPEMLFNIAQSYRLAGDLANALFFYRSYLRNMPKGGNRVEVEGRIRKIEAELLRQHKVVSEPPNAAEAWPGDKNAAPQNNPAASQNNPAASQNKSATTPNNAAPQQKDAAPQNNAAPQTSAAPQNNSRADLVQAPPAATPTYKKWWVWTVTGAVAVAAAVGVSLGVTLGTAPPAPASHFGTRKVY